MTVGKLLELLKDFDEDIEVIIGRSYEEEEGSPILFLKLEERGLCIYNDYWAM